MAVITPSTADVLRAARDRIANAKDWRRGAGDERLWDSSPYCAGAAIWYKGIHPAVENLAIRALLVGADLPLPDPPDEDAEIDALVEWNDSAEHAEVLAAFDRAIAAAEAAA